MRKAHFLSSEANVRYLSNFKASFVYLLIFEDKKSKNILFTDSRYLEATKDIVNFNIVSSSSSDILVDLKKILIDERITTLALEFFDISHSFYKDIEDKFIDINIELVACDEYYKMAREIKKPLEIEYIKSALDIAFKSYNELLNSYVKEGISEKELAASLDYLMLSKGAEALAFDTIVAFSENAAIPHHSPSYSRKLKNNDLVLIDFGCKYCAYCSDTTRCFGFKLQDKEIIKDYNTVLKANTEAIKILKEGISVKDVDNLTRNIIKNALGEDVIKHSTGHGVGLEIHERPFISYKNEANILKEGNVITIEPGIYKKNYGIRIEDMILVQKYDNIILSSNFDNNLIII